jgi:glycosyltransferase involved in cell wall biosynthesis
MRAMPALSVLLPVRDALPYLRASLGSLARQTFRDFEIVAVDDGSSDGSGAWLERAQEREPRLRVLHTPPAGLPAALAAALAASGAPLVARQDADDVSHRERFALQIEALRAQPEVSVLGTRVRLFPAPAVGVGMRRWAAWHNALLEHEEIVRELWIDSSLAHGTAMMRRDALERAGGWRERGWPEDLDLWFRMRETDAVFAKLPRALYGWRQHAGSATRRDPRYRIERFVELKLDALVRGPLAGNARVTVVGVGTSLERWRAALASRGLVVAHTARTSAALAAALDAGGLEPPLVLVYVAASARARMRRMLEDRGFAEPADFVFVA